MLWTRLNDRFPTIATLLSTAVRTGRIGHAYLFSGDNADLLADCALAWGEVCACLATTPAGQPCGECRNCRLLEAENYPELNVLRPQSKSRAIVVDRIREFEHQLGLSAERGRLKIGLIREAECMNAQAQNAFLKTLEEPPARTLLLLTTTRPQALLPTIRSRCQQVSLLENRRDYSLAVDADVPGVLAALRPGGGAQCALKAAAGLCSVFGGLREQAAAQADEDSDARWQQAAENDAQLRKELENEQKARESAHYLALREQMVEAIQTWAHQEYLRAIGVPLEELPHPEIIGTGTGGSPPPPAEAKKADQVMDAVEHFSRVMRTNADESLAIHAFCLEVARKSAPSRRDEPDEGRERSAKRAAPGTRSP